MNDYAEVLVLVKREIVVKGMKMDDFSPSHTFLFLSFFLSIFLSLHQSLTYSRVEMTHAHVLLKKKPRNISV